MGSLSNASKAPVDEISVLRATNAELHQKLQASEAARRQQEERFKDLAESIQEVFWICDPGLTQTLYVSPAYEKIWGHTCQSLYEDPQSFLAAMHPQDRERTLARIKNQEWTGYCEEYRIIRPDGDIRWIRDRAWPVRDESGKVIRVVGIAEDISFHKAVETSLRRYEQMVSTANVLMVFIDRDYRYQTVSKPYAETFEMAQENIIGKSLGEVVGSMAFERIKPYLDRCLQGESVSFEHWLDLPARGCCYLLVHYNPYYESDGSVSGIVADITDITERKLAEENFKESEEKFRSMAETVPDIIFTNRPDGSCDFVNQRLYEYTGLPSGSGLGFGWTKALHPDDLERSKDKWLRTMHLGLSYEDRYRIISPNGTYRWFMARALPIKNAKGQIEKYFGVSTDIHDLVQTEEALRQSEERLDYALDATREGVWDWDIKTDRVLFSNRWCENLGFASEEIEPHLKSWKSLVHPEDLAMVIERLEAHIEGKTPVYTSENRLLTKSGMWRWYLDVGKVVARDQDGRPLRMVGVDVDITERKKEQALLETIRQAQSQFISANDPSEMFDHLLNNLLSITQSEYGFIGEILFTPEGKPYLKTQAIANIAWNQETREMYERFAPNLEFFNLNSLFGEVITTGQPVVANDPMNDPRRAGLPKGHPPMHAFLGLPFYRGDRLVGMVGIANRPEGYDEQLIAYLQPLLTTCGILIEAYQNSQQRIQAEATLRTTEQMYRQILDSISDMVFVKDQNFRMLWGNKAFKDYYNMTNDELRGILDSPINEPEFTKQYHEADAHVLNTGKILDIPEEPVTQHDGQVHLFHTIKAPLFGENGEVVKLVGVARDITERKQAEEVIRTGERKFRAIYEQAPTGIAVLDSLNGRFTQINQKYCDITGYSQEEMLARTFQDITYPDDLQADLDNIQQLLAGEISSFKREKRYIRKSGEVIWVNLTCIPLWLESTDPRQHMTMVEDITYRKKGEKALQESEERFRLLNEAIPQQVWSAQPDGSLDYVNQRVLQYFDCSFKEIIDHGWQRFVHPDDLPGCLERWDKARETQQPYEIEFRLLGGKGHSFRWHLGRALPIFDQDGQVVKWFGTNTDITQFKQLEDQIRQSQKMEAIGTLAGGIAHDFNNILMAITGYTELATFNSRGNNAAQRNLEEVLVAGQRAKELVQQILTFSRQSDQERQPLELKLVVKEVCKFLRASLPATIEIRQNFTQVPTIILGDPIQMHQVVMNLCANAEHAMRESGGLLDLKVEHVTGETDGIGIHPDLTGDSYVRLTVRDTGGGMDQDVAKRIFDPFFTTKGVGEGTGMGLAVVHGIVTNHGGCINVESEPGQGTTFTIDFPEMEARSIQGDNKPLQQEFLMGHGNILFVEDEAPLARLGEEAMRNLGYEVMVRTSSVEALEAFRADPLRFDAVVTDQTMPNMTGEALSRELLQIRSDVPIILCTGFSHSMTPEKAKAMGIRAFLLKPLLIKDLGRTLHEVLHG